MRSVDGVSTLRHIGAAVNRRVFDGDLLVTPDPILYPQMVAFFFRMNRRLYFYFLVLDVLLHRFHFNPSPLFKRR